jgi:hypothetical protein
MTGGVVDGVADPGVEAVTAERRVEVRGVPGEEHPPAPDVVDQLHPRRPRIGRQDPGVDAGRGADEAVRIAFPGLAIDAEGDEPPGPGAVERAENAGSVRVHRPVLHGGTVRHVVPQAGPAEDHPEVGPQGVLAGVRRTDLVPHHAAGAVGAHHVVGGDDGSGSGAVDAVTCTSSAFWSSDSTERPVASRQGSRASTVSRSSSSRTN